MPDFMKIKYFCQQHKTSIFPRILFHGEIQCLGFSVPTNMETPLKIFHRLLSTVLHLSIHVSSQVF